jgi:ComF family protein
LPRSIRVCERCRREEFAFDRLVAVAPYRGLYARVLREFKFRRRTSLARLIGRLMATDLLEFPDDCVLVPAPSSRRNVRRRGFAGAALIARELSACTGRPLIHALTLCGRREQKALDYEGRKANTRNVIGTRRRAQRELAASGRPVIVIDDVATTGTTADACARALRVAGVRTVIVLVFAMEY